MVSKKHTTYRRGDKMNTNLLCKSVPKTTIGLLIASRTPQGAYEQITRLLERENIDHLILNPCFSTDEDGTSTKEENYFAFEISYSTSQEQEALENIIKKSHIELYLTPMDRNQVVEVIKKKQEAKLFFRGELVKEGEYSVIQQIADEFASWYRLGKVKLKEQLNLSILPFKDEMTVSERITPVVSKETMKEASITLFAMMDEKELTSENFLYRYNSLNERCEIFMKSDVQGQFIQHEQDVQENLPVKGDYDKWTVTWMLESGGHYNAPFDTAQEALEQVEELQKEGVDATLITVFEPHVNISLDKLKQYAEKNE